MKKMVKYVADDGTPFDTEKDCIEYEEKLANKYVIYHKGNIALINNETLAKRYIANLLHDCYENNHIGDFKLVHCGKTVEFNSSELSKFVPAHYKIDGDKLDEVFQMRATKNVKIKGYTLHGDYYLADEIIPNRNWKEACKMRKFVNLPNGKMVIAHTLSKEELEAIPQKERKCDNWNWYWTSTPNGDDYAWDVGNNGGFSYYGVDYGNVSGGARLGFKNPFI